MKAIRIPALRISGDGIKIPDNWRPAYDKMIAFCKKNRGGYIQVTIEEPFKPRTTGDKSQNHCINGWIAQIAEYTGDDHDYIKYHIKKKAIKRGFPFHTNRKGKAVPDSERDISTTEAGYLIETIKEVADFLKLKLRDDKEME